MPLLRVWPVAASAVLLLPLGAAGQGAPSGGSSLSGAIGSELVYNAANNRGGFSGADTVLRVTPSLRLDSRSGRVQGTLSYSAQAQAHSQPYDGETVEHQLATAWSVAAIERFAFIDLNGTVSQQAVDAYGPASSSGSVGYNANRTTVVTASVSPYLRGVLASAVSYELRHTVQATNGYKSKAADSSNQSTTLQLSSMAGGTLLGWSLQASTQTVDFRVGRETRSDRVLAGLSFFPDPDWTLAVRGGQERTDVADAVQTTYDNWGAGVTWRPSPRTRAQLDVDERFFGRGHRASVEHRLSRSSLRLTSSRDSSSGSTLSNGSATLFQLLDRQLAATESDPVRREQLVLAQLRAANADPNARVSFGYISSAINLVESNLLAFAYGGPRLSFGLQGFGTVSRVIDATATATARVPVRQRGADLSLGYRLTPVTSVTAVLSTQQTRDTELQRGGTLDAFTWSLTHQFARRTSIGVGGRYAEQRGTTNPYREGQLQASLSVRF